MYGVCSVVTEHFPWYGTFFSLENIVMFEQEQGPLKPLNPGQVIEAVFEITNPCFNNPDKKCMECSNWNDELMQFNRFELDVKESSVSTFSLWCFQKNK